MKSIICATGIFRTAGRCIPVAAAIVVLNMAVGCPLIPDLTAPAPGLNVVITGVNIPAVRRPRVHFTASDDAGNRIPLEQLEDVRFILAYRESNVDEGTARFLSYTTSAEDPDGVPSSGDEALQASYDSARLGGVSQNADGSFTYVFSQVLPVDYPQTATHQVGGQFARLDPIEGVEYVANAVLAFRPAGLAFPEKREVVATEACNACHTRLSVHGDVRREVQLCILCHNTQTTDAQSGNALDFPQMIHKIHYGENLPSVEDGEPYVIFGFMNAPNDYSNVVYPQDTRNCQSCHTDAPDAEHWMTEPTLAGCASCHDRTWFGNPDEAPAGFTEHVGGQQVDSSLCSLCHTPTAPGASPILEAHYIPSESPQAPGLFLDIADVNILPAKQEVGLQIMFTASNAAGEPITSLDGINVASTVAYPVTEYEVAIREAINGFGGPIGTLVNNGDGSYLYTFSAGLPADADYSFAVAMEGRRTFMFRGEEVTQGTATNGRTVFTIDGSEPDQRRDVVSTENCNACHRELRAHGELRVGADYCVMCHNPGATDIAQRPEDELPPVTINFKNLVHQIHRGTELEAEYTVYGFGMQPHDFTEVEFPGRLEQCSICHVDDSMTVPLPGEALSTIVAVDGGVVSETLPATASCVSCHDTLEEKLHAMLNTDFEAGIESCVVCHGEASAFAVQVVHELGP